MSNWLSRDSVGDAGQGRAENCRGFAVSTIDHHENMDVSHAKNHQ